MLSKSDLERLSIELDRYSIKSPVRLYYTEYHTADTNSIYCKTNYYKGSVVLISTSTPLQIISMDLLREPFITEAGEQNLVKRHCFSLNGYRTIELVEKQLNISDYYNPVYTIALNNIIK